MSQVAAVQIIPTNPTNEEEEKTNLGPNPVPVPPPPVDIQPLRDEHTQILAKEEEIKTKQEEIKTKEDEILEKINRQLKKMNGAKGTSSGATDMGVQLIMKIVRFYFAMIFKFGEMAANMILPMIFGQDIYEQISGQKDIDMATLSPILDKQINIISNKEYRAKIQEYFQELSMPARNLLSQISDVFIDVGTKNSTKLVSLVTTSLSAFPPIALFYDFALLGSVALNTMISGLNLAGVSMDGLNDFKDKLMEKIDPPSDEEIAKTAAEREREIAKGTTTLATAQGATTTTTTTTPATVEGATTPKKLSEMLSFDSAKEQAKKTKDKIMNNEYVQTATGLAKGLGNDIAGVVDKKVSKFIGPSTTETGEQGTTPSSITEKASSLFDKAKAFGTNAATNIQSRATGFMNDKLPLTMSKLNPQTPPINQSGGAEMKRVRSQTKRVSSRIIHSLKCFRDTDNIKSNKRKTCKKRSNHKNTHKRKYKYKRH